MTEQLADDGHVQQAHAEQLRDQLAQAHRTIGGLRNESRALRHQRDRAVAERDTCELELQRLRPLPAQLAAAKAEAARWVAMIGRGFTEHMRFGLAHPDGTTEMLACADWCYACKLDAANARAERAEAGAKILSASIARVQMLHQPCQFVESWTCAECARTGAAAPDWPCPTIAAVDGPADQLAAALPLEALDADALTRLIRAAQYRRAEIDPDRCPADCAEGHTYTAPCSGAYPDSGSDRGAAEVSRSLGGMVDRMLGGNVGAAFTDPAPPVPTYADLLTIATECRVPKPRRTGERSTASTASGLTVVTTDPVEEIAAEPATLDRLKRQFLEVPAGRIGALPGQIGDFFGFPLMVDEGLPPGEVHMRPMYRMDEAQP